MQQKFDRSALGFDLSVNNPSDFSNVLTSIGIRTSETVGHFGCAPRATHVVFFGLGDSRADPPAVTIPADPPIHPDPQASARFTIGLSPNDIGRCGGWSSNVRAVLEFSDGSKLETEPQLLTDEDMRGREKPEKEALRIGLQHRDPRVRLDAIYGMERNPQPVEIAETLLRPRLEDKDVRVKTAAEWLAGKLHLGGLGPKLLENLKENISTLRAAISNSETDFPIEQRIDGEIASLGQIRYVPAVDTIIDICFDEKKHLLLSCEPSLANIKETSVSQRLFALLKAKRSWLQWEDQDKRGQYYTSIGIDLDHRYVPASSYILAQIDSKEGLSRQHSFVSLASYVLHNLLETAPRDQLITDPFILKFEPIAEKFAAMRKPDIDVYFDAQLLLEGINGKKQ